LIRRWGMSPLSNVCLLIGLDEPLRFRGPDRTMVPLAQAC